MRAHLPNLAIPMLAGAMLVIAVLAATLWPSPPGHHGCGPDAMADRQSARLVHAHALAAESDWAGAGREAREVHEAIYSDAAFEAAEREVLDDTGLHWALAYSVERDGHADEAARMRLALAENDLANFRQMVLGCPTLACDAGRPQPGRCRR